MSFSMPTEDDFATLVSRIRKEWPDCVGIGVFGSVARGTPHEGSDVDLLIALISGSVISRILYTRWDEFVAPELKNICWSPHFVECLRENASAGSLWLEFADHGKTLWTTDVFERSFRSLRDEINAGKYERRKEPGSSFYWIKRG